MFVLVSLPKASSNLESLIIPESFLTISQIKCPSLHGGNKIRFQESCEVFSRDRILYYVDCSIPILRHESFFPHHYVWGSHSSNSRAQ